uniref:Uncharacterized protein n=1 Tax=Rhizophora mucronata TaxID=61149 RepID=A0A2P2QI21_RHIMU
MTQRKIWSSPISNTQLTIPANCETSMKNARAAARIPMITVLFTGTWVCVSISEKNDGNNPSLAIPKKSRG